jgi:COP9 signalosome complex subunit 12
VNRRILAYLIPLRMLKGNLPSALLLSRFPNISAIYTPFINAIRAGDVQGYDRALEENELKLLDLNLWVSVEKARELCLRGLFRKVCVSLPFIFACIPDVFRQG